jgi:hypothetical protein
MFVIFYYIIFKNCLEIFEKILKSQKNVEKFFFFSMFVGRIWPSCWAHVACLRCPGVIRLLAFCDRTIQILRFVIKLRLDYSPLFGKIAINNENRDLLLDFHTAQVLYPKHNLPRNLRSPFPGVSTTVHLCDNIIWK